MTTANYSVVTIHGIGYSLLGAGLVALFSYIGNVMAEAFKATRTVQKGKVSPSSVEKGVGATYPDLGMGALGLGTGKCAAPMSPKPSAPGTAY